MPNRNPYAPKDDRDARSLDDFVDDAVNAGLNLGSTVLSGIADALNSVGAAVGAAAPKPDAFAAYRRGLDARLANRFGGWMTMGVLGWVFGGSFAIAALVMAILAGAAAASPVLAAYRTVFLALAPAFTACALGFGTMGYGGCHNANYFGRLRRYLRVSRGFAVPLAELARMGLVNTQKLRRDLRQAIAKGDYPNACLDAAETTLYLDESLCVPAAPSKAQAEEHAVPPTDAETFRREGADFLNYLKSCQGRLGADADEELAAMRKICAAVLGFVHNHPEQLPRVRRFRVYYIPTTRKLLNTAMGLGEADTDSAQTIRRDITGILHTLNTAYARLYDTLLQDVSLDVSTEIDTLETMLSQDGLTQGFASDFGAQSRL